MRTSLKLKNIGRIQQSLLAVAREEAAHTLEQIEEIGHKVLEKSVELAPEKTGALKASGRRLPTRALKNGRQQIRVRFGDRSAPYAGYVHWSPFDSFENGQALFLLSAVREMEPALFAVRLKGARRKT